MPASEKMESSFSLVETRCCRDASRSGDFQSPNLRGRFQIAPPCLLVHARRYAMAAVGLDARGAAAERAEKHDRRNEGK
jgi:hypothetical protein